MGQEETASELTPISATELRTQTRDILERVRFHALRNQCCGPVVKIPKPRYPIGPCTLQHREHALSWRHREDFLSVQFTFPEKPAL